MEQKNTVKFTNEDNKICFMCETDTPIGVIHDFLMMLKGMMVDRMVSAQKQEQEITDQKKLEDTSEEE